MAFRLPRIDGDAIDRDDRVPAALLAALKRAGAFGLTVPRAHGGRGLNRAAYHRVVAAIAEKSAGLSMWVTTHNGMAAGAIDRFGSAPLRAELLPRLAAGELGAFAMSEERAGADPSKIRAAARRVRGGWRLDGRKLWVTNAPDARWLVVVARAPGGLTAFIVDMRTKGVRVERRCRFLGLRGMSNGVVSLRGVRVPDARRLGDEGGGLRVALGTLGVARLSVAARALGIARACRTASRAWVRARGLAQPAVKARLRRLDGIVRALEALNAAAGKTADFRLESARIKIAAGEAAFEAADIALALRGPRGYETAESQRARGEAPVPAERWLRDARGLRVIEGSEDVLRAMLDR